MKEREREGDGRREAGREGEEGRERKGKRWGEEKAEEGGREVEKRRRKKRCFLFQLVDALLEYTEF